MKKRLLSAISIGFVGVFGLTHAATITWTGTSGSDWNNASNWSPSSVPQSADTVIIDLNAGNQPLIDAASVSISILTIGSTTASGSNTALSLQNGATLTTSGSILIANAANSYGTLSLSGSGTSITASSSVRIFSGTGFINILDGASLTTTSFVEVGSLAGSNGTLHISGANSQLNLTTFYVGINGSGTALIENGGKIVSASNDFTLAFNAGSSGTLTVRNAGSSLTTGGSLYVGRGGSSTLNVLNGGLVSVRNLFIGGAANAPNTGTGTVTVSGADSRLSVSTALAIGYSAGSNVLTVENGATVTGATTVLGNLAGGSGTLNLNGNSTDGYGVLETQSVTKGPGSGQVNFNGGVLRASASNTGFLSGVGVSIASGGATIDSNTYTVTAGSILAGDGALTKTGTGTLILTANNTYAGGTTVTNGTLQAGNGSTTGSITGNVSLSSSTAVFAINRSDNFTYGNIISGSGSFTKMGSNTIILSADQTYTGTTSIAGGTLQLGDGTGAAGWVNSASVVLSSNTNLAFNHTTAKNFAGNLSGGGNIIKQGSNTLTLTGSSIITGTAYADAGSLIVNGNLGAGNIEVARNAGSVATLTFDNGIQVTHTGMFVGRQGNATLNINNATVTSNSIVYAGYDAAATTPGTGTIHVDGANAVWNLNSGLFLGYNGTGAMTLSSGARVIGPAVGNIQIGSGTSGQGSLSVQSGGVLTTRFDVFVGAQRNGDVTVTGAGSQWNVTGGSVNIGSSSTGTLTIEKNGLVNAASLRLGQNTGSAGTVYLKGNSTDGRGILLTGGLLGGSTSSANKTLILDGGILRASATSATFIASASGIGVGVTANGAYVDTNGFNITIGASMNDSGGSGFLVKQGAGTLILGANTYTGSTTVENGTLQASAQNILASSSSLTVNSGATFNLGSFGQSVNKLSGSGTIALGSGSLTVNNATLTDNSTFSGAINGTGGLIKTGNGRLTINGQNSYTGTTLLSGGSMELTIGASLGNTAVTVASGSTLVVNGTANGTATINGTLMGSGTVTGNAVVNGILAPGNSPGTIYFGSDLTLTGTAVVQIEIDHNTLDYDIIDVVGIIDLGGAALDVDLDGLSLFAYGSQVDIIKANNLTGSWSSGNTYTDSHSRNWQFSFESGVGSLKLAIPEPSSYAGLFGFVTFAFALTRRSRRK